MRAVLKLSCMAVVSVLGVSQARAVLVYTGPSTVDRNLSAPASNADPSKDYRQPYNYMGQWGVFTGVPISSNAFITAQHVGGSSAFVYNGNTYYPTGSYTDIGTDLRVWTITGSFGSNYAPLYTGSDEVGRDVVMVGRGTAAGDEVRDFTGALRGWKWGTDDHQMSWGVNSVYDVAGDYVRTVWENAGGHLSTITGGDSGGGMFIYDSGQWKLAGILSRVTGNWRTKESEAFFGAAIMDAKNLYLEDVGLITYDALTAASAARISSHSSEILSAGSASVPEPSVALAMGAASLLLLRRRVGR